MCMRADTLIIYPTHPMHPKVWRIACRDYDPSLKGSKSLAPAIYERVGDLFRDRYGPHAGWCVTKGGRGVGCVCIACFFGRFDESVDSTYIPISNPHTPRAHSLLFAAELPNYRKRLPPALQAEMEAFKREESEVCRYVCMCVYTCACVGVCMYTGPI